jgi:hypothetical protein
MIIIPKSRVETDRSIANDYERRKTPFSEFIGAKVSESFDWTTPGAIGNAIKVSETNDPVITKEEWKQSENFRKEIEFEDFSENQASEYARLFDERQYNKSLIERSPTGFRSIAGFGASMITQLIDPVNYIPFAGIIGKGAAVGKGIKTAVASSNIIRRAGIGAVDAFIGTALTEPFIARELNKQGEDITFNQIALDLMFAPAIGGTFGAVGGAITARRALRQENRLKVGNMMEKALVDDDIDAQIDISAQHRRYAPDLNKDLPEGSKINIEETNYSPAKQYPDLPNPAPKKFTTEIDQIKNEVADVGINAETGHFRQIDEIENLRKEGLITADDELTLKGTEVDIDETFNAYRLAGECLTR